MRRLKHKQGLQKLNLYWPKLLFLCSLIIGLRLILVAVPFSPNFENQECDFRDLNIPECAKDGNDHLFYFYLARINTSENYLQNGNLRSKLFSRIVPTGDINYNENGQFKSISVHKFRDFKKYDFDGGLEDDSYENTIIFPTAASYFSPLNNVFYGTSDEFTEFMQDELEKLEQQQYNGSEDAEYFNWTASSWYEVFVIDNNGSGCSGNEKGDCNDDLPDSDGDGFPDDYDDDCNQPGCGEDNDDDDDDDDDDDEVPCVQPIIEYKGNNPDQP